MIEARIKELKGTAEPARAPRGASGAKAVTTTRGPPKICFLSVCDYVCIIIYISIVRDLKDLMVRRY